MQFVKHDIEMIEEILNNLSSTDPETEYSIIKDFRSGLYYLEDEVPLIRTFEILLFFGTPSNIIAKIKRAKAKGRSL